MTAKSNGPSGWVLDNSVMSENSEVQQILARVETDYQEIITRLCKGIGDMIAARDGDAMMLLQRTMMLGVNEIQDTIVKLGVEVQ